ncbi:hypothetical protein FB451DRAFT_1172204 [Mycena latifolia]|nr:hypothetical protein FB451DRAFT_1172204 [Mycena latifolia]
MPTPSTNPAALLMVFHLPRTHAGSRRSVQPLGDKAVIEDELAGFGIRLNEHPPAILVRRKEKGGIAITNTVALTNIDHDNIKGILSEFKINNCDIAIRHPPSANLGPPLTTWFTLSKATGWDIDSREDYCYRFSLGLISVRILNEVRSIDPAFFGSNYCKISMEELDLASGSDVTFWPIPPVIRSPCLFQSPLGSG